MKKRSFLILLVCIVFINTAKSQLININPDPNGEPWLIYEWTGISDEEQAFIDSIPLLELNTKSEEKLLPSSVDNSQLIYMRDIFSQVGASGFSANLASYIYTYEVNRIRNTNANILENQYSYNFIYNPFPYSNYLNWEVLRQFGCPNVPTWDPENLNLYIDDKKYMNSYEEYFSCLNYKMTDINRIWLEDFSGTKLVILKHWLNDHALGENTGGVAFMSGAINTSTVSELSNVNGNETGKPCATEYTSHAYDAYTVVGYNDNIKYDFNGDGLYTNNLDIAGNYNPTTGQNLPILLFNQNSMPYDFPIPDVSI